MPAEPDASQPNVTASATLLAAVTKPPLLLLLSCLEATTPGTGFPPSPPCCRLKGTRCTAEAQGDHGLAGGGTWLRSWGLPGSLGDEAHRSPLAFLREPGAPGPGLWWARSQLWVGGPQQAWNNSGASKAKLFLPGSPTYQAEMLQLSRHFK